MITKDEAMALATIVTDALAERINATLSSNAHSGTVGTTVVYGMSDSEDIDGVVATLEGAGWTVARDDTAQTLVITAA